MTESYPMCFVLCPPPQYLLDALNQYHRKRQRRGAAPPATPEKNQPTLAQALGVALCDIRPRRHNANFDALQCADLPTLLVRAAVLPGGKHGAVDVRAYFTMRSLSRAFRDEADRVLDARLDALRKALAALRAAFDADLLERPLQPTYPSAHSRRRALIERIRVVSREATEASEATAVATAAVAYLKLTRRSFGEVVARNLVDEFYRLAQWTSRAEIVAWTLGACVGCRQHVTLLGPASQYHPDWLLWRTAACHYCRAVSGCSAYRTDQRSRWTALDREYDAVSRASSAVARAAGASAERVNMRALPGLPIECTQVAKSGLGAERVAQLAADAEADEKARRAALAVVRTRRRDASFETLKAECVAYVRRVAPDLPFETARAASYALPSWPLPSTRKMPSIDGHERWCRLGEFEKGVDKLLEQTPAYAGARRADVVRRLDAHLLRGTAARGARVTRLGVYMAALRHNLQPSAAPFGDATRCYDRLSTADAIEMERSFVANVAALDAIGALDAPAPKPVRA